MTQEWQPIETAPKDGSRIIVYRPGADKSDYIHKIGIDRFSVKLGGVWENSNSFYQPTHWTPLPSPPTEPAKGQ